MRDQKRIREFCNRLASYWETVPDWRFGQLICNVLGTAKRNPFFIEEEEMLKLFSDYFSNEVISKYQQEDSHDY